MKKHKVGLAFPDYILNNQTGRKRAPLGPPNSEILLLFPLIFLAIVFGLVFLRLIYLQVLRKSYYEVLSFENRTRTENIPSARGVILDRKGRALVTNIPAFKVLENGTIQFLSKEDALDKIAKGETVENDITREYTNNGLFAHVVGYIGQISEKELENPAYAEYSHLDLVGKIGLEKEYEEILHGINGRELYEVDAMGKRMRSLGIEDPKSGQNLKTTLDLDIQKLVFDAMGNVTRGAVVVSDPRNGGILALVSLPTFDPNLFTHPVGYVSTGDYTTLEGVLLDTKMMPLLDRAIGGAYPPGSTFKLITATAALEEKKINEDTLIEDTGVVELGGLKFGTWYYLQYGRTEGELDIVKAISRSNDIFFYRAAEKLGDERLSEWSRNFGLGGKLGIDIAGEERGTVPNNAWKEATIGEKWYTGDTFNMGIGQGYVLTTPLQVNAFTNVFANNGVLYRPHLVMTQEHVLNKDFVSKKTRELVRDGMKQSCETGGVAYTFFNFGVVNKNLKIDDKDYQKGTSASANFVRIPVGCKTGTAQTPGDKNEPHAWITVFAPFYNPEISVTVLVENGGEGSKVAGPIATEILRKYFERK